MKILNAFTYVDHNSYEGKLVIGEKNTGISLTVPDQVPSLAEMLRRYVRGGDVQMFTPVYTDDENIPDNLERMNEIERIELAREMKTAIDVHRDALNKRPYIVHDNPDGTVDEVEVKFKKPRQEPTE